MEPLQPTHSIIHNASVKAPVYYARCEFCSWQVESLSYTAAGRLACAHYDEEHAPKSVT
jgi:hypothetical protein